MNMFDPRQREAKAQQRSEVTRAQRERRSDVTFMAIFGLGVCGAIAAFVAVLLDLGGETINPKDFRPDEPTRISSGPESPTPPAKQLK